MKKVSRTKIALAVGLALTAAAPFRGADQDAAQAVPLLIQQCCEHFDIGWCCRQVERELWMESGGEWPGSAEGGDADDILILSRQEEEEGTPYEEPSSGER